MKNVNSVSSNDIQGVEVAPGIHCIWDDPDNDVLTGSTDAVARFLLTQTYGDTAAAIALAHDCVIGMAATDRVVEAIARLPQPA